MRHLGGFDIGGIVDFSYPLAGLWQADEAAPVPHQTPNIKLVPQDAGAALALATDSGVAPEAATRTWNTFAVERGDDHLGGMAGGVEGKDAPDDIGLLLDDLSVARLSGLARLDRRQGAVSIGDAAGQFALIDAPGLAALGLVPKVLRKLLGDQAQHGDVEVADLTGLDRMHLDPVGG
nr:hypothetical protein [Magnetospirillum sp. XM-1]